MAKTFFVAKYLPANKKEKTYRLEGGEVQLAFTKEEKIKMMEQYENWLQRSQAVFMLQYGKMNMKEVDSIRAKAREVGGEMHVVKNTIFGRVLDDMGWDGKDFLDQTTLIGFAFNDAPALAKVISDAVKSDIFTVKGGLLAKHGISPAQVKALADMPPLPVIRAQLLGVLNAPAGKLVRTINEPARGLAAVIKARQEKEAGPAAEPAA
jgi:large subunit ribosomal protein L10